MVSTGFVKHVPELGYTRTLTIAASAGCLLLVCAARIAPTGWNLHAADALLLVTIVLSVWVARRRDRRLRVVYNDLEQRVAERTAQLEEALTAQRVLFDVSPVALQVFDAETLRFLAANAAALKLTGYSNEELTNMTVMDTTVQATADLPAAIRGFTGEWSGRSQLKTRDGSALDVEISMRPLDFHGRRAWMVAVTDVTASDALEKQLRHAQKMDAVGRLAGGVAHEFNDMLSVLLGYADLLLDGRPANDPLVEPLMEMKRAGERASDVAQRLLAFSRLQPRHVQVLDLNDSVRAASALVDEIVTLPGVVERTLASEDCFIRADPSQIEQIIVNLVGNARDAMPAGGTIAVETTVDLQSAPYGGDPTPYVKLIVTDAGTGIDAETKARIFEPFFTTKPQGDGVGLGLSIVYSIVEECGGLIDVASAAGGGTKVSISFPAVRFSQAAVVARPSSPAQNAVCVLLVAQETEIASRAWSALLRAGYRVLVARGAGEAALMFEEHIDEIDVLLTEPEVGAMRGAELARRLQVARPSLEVVFLPEQAAAELICSEAASTASTITNPALSERLRTMLALKSRPENHATQ